MKDQSKKSDQPTLWDSLSNISSPGLEDGPSPSPSPDGPLTGPVLPEVVPASPSARQAKGKKAKTPDISGPPSFGSSASADLQRSLASRLAALLGTTGSPEYRLTWSRQAIASGLLICRLRASARPISDKGCSGWPTPDAQDFGSSDSRWEERREEIKAQKINGNGFGLTLGMAAQLAGWASPAARDWRDGRASDETMERNSRPLNEQVVSGMTAASSSAETGKLAASVLNPRFSLWLQGYPDVWACCGELAIRSCRKRRRSL